MRICSPAFLALALFVGLAAPSEAFAAQVPCNAWDATFAAPGPDAAFEDFVTFDDGTGPALYAAGPFRAIGSQKIDGVARWNGTSWSPVGDGLPEARRLAIFDDGSGPALYAAGAFRIQDGAPANTIARWNGTSWLPLAGNGPTGQVANVQALAVFDDGTGPTLYIAGRVSLPGIPAPSNRVVRWDGATWSGVSDGIPSSETPSSLAVFDPGTGPGLYVGISQYAPLGAVRRWNGTSWVSVWPAGTVGRVNALEIYAGSLYAAGDVSGGLGGDGIVRYDGATWSRLGSGLANANGNPATGFALGVHDDGQGARLYVGGIFDTAGGTPAAGIASWDGATWRALPPGLEAALVPNVRALGSFDDGGGPGLFAGGTFSRAGRTVADKAVMWRNGVWSRLADGAGLSGSVTALCAHDDGSGRALFASGYFDTAGTTLAKGIARWNGATWRALGDPLDSDGIVYALLAADLGAGPKLVAGGAFTRIGGVAAAGIASWDGTSWSPLGGGVDGFVEGIAVFDDGSGPSLYVGGQFTLAGGVAASNVARWNGSSWSALGSGTDFQVHDLETFDDGTGAALYACGNFNFAGGIPVVRVARWNGSSWSAVGNEIVPGSGQMFDLQTFDDGTGAQLYLAGLAILGTDLVRVVRWNGAAWSAAGVPPTNNVFTLTVFHDGNGPRLCTPDAPLTGNTLTRIRAFDGSQWQTLPGTIEGGGVSSLAAWDFENDGVPDLYAGGNFRAAGGEPAANFARFRSCGTEGIVECAGNGSFGVCPCGNTGAIDHGCANSVHAAGARLSSDGLASLASDTLVLAAEGMTGTFAIFAQGTTIAGSTGVPFDDGLLCVAGTVQRLGSASIAGASASLPSAGGTRLSQLGGITAPGQTRVYQTIYRNAASFCTSGSSNMTNGLSVIWSL